MKQIEIIKSIHYDDLVNKVNEFIKKTETLDDKIFKYEIIDVRFKMALFNEQNVDYYAMVLYEVREIKQVKVY